MSEWLDFFSILVVIVFGVLGILIQIWLASQEDERRKSERRKEQRQILNSIETWLLEIENARVGHVGLIKKRIVPSYFIPEIDVSYYVSQLNSEIPIRRGKKNTIILKQFLVKVNNKIKNINRVLELVQNTFVFVASPMKTKLFNELEHNTYYEDLKNLLEQLRQEWMKLEGYM